MKHLVGRLESQPLSGAVIQSVFDHSQLLIGDSFHAPLLGNVLAQQTIEVFVAAALSRVEFPGFSGYPSGAMKEWSRIRLGQSHPGVCAIWRPLGLDSKAGSSTTRSSRWAQLQGLDTSAAG